MKALVIALAAIAAFAAAALVPLHLSGNLNKEGIERIFGKEPPPAPAEEADTVSQDPLTDALKKKEESLKAREEELRQKEEQVKKMTADLEALRSDIATMQAQMEEKLSQEDAAQAERLQTVAQSLSKMKPANAAASLESWDPKEAATVLKLVKERERGRILDAMGDKAAPLLRALQDKRL